MSEMINLPTDDLDAEVAKNPTTLVDFYATWCGPCSILSTRLEAYVKQEGAVPVIKVDVDKHPELAKEHKVMSIPHLLLLDSDSKKLAEIRGALSLTTLTQWVKDNS